MGGKQEEITDVEELLKGYKEPKKVNWSTVVEYTALIVMFIFAMVSIVKYGHINEAYIQLEAEHNLTDAQLNGLNLIYTEMSEQLINAEYQRYHLVKGFCRQLNFNTGFVGLKEDYSDNITVTCVKNNGENITAMHPFELYD